MIYKLEFQQEIYIRNRNLGVINWVDMWEIIVIFIKNGIIIFFFLLYLLYLYIFIIFIYTIFYSSIFLYGLLAKMLYFLPHEELCFNLDWFCLSADCVSDIKCTRNYEIRGYIFPVIMYLTAYLVRRWL